MYRLINNLEDVNNDNTSHKPNTSSAHSATPLSVHNIRSSTNCYQASFFTQIISEYGKHFPYLLAMHPFWNPLSLVSKFKFGRAHHLHQLPWLTLIPSWRSIEHNSLLDLEDNLFRERNVVRIRDQHLIDWTHSKLTLSYCQAKQLLSSKSNS